MLFECSLIQLTKHCNLPLPDDLMLTGSVGSVTISPRLSLPSPTQTSVARARYEPRQRSGQGHRYLRPTTRLGEVGPQGTRVSLRSRATHAVPSFGLRVVRTVPVSDGVRSGGRTGLGRPSGASGMNWEDEDVGSEGKWRVFGTQRTFGFRLGRSPFLRI